MKIKQILTFCAILSVAGMSFIGCDSETTTTPPDNTPKVYAGTNSTYTYKKNYKDASGNVSGTDTAKTATVTEGPHSYGGKDTTITVIENGTDTTIMSYEANGNVSIYRGNGIPGAPVQVPVPTWWTLSAGTKDSLMIMDQTTDISFTINGINVKVNRVKGDAVWRSTENITVGAETLSCQKVDVVFNIYATIMGILPATLKFNTSYYYSAKLGYFAKYDTQNTYPQQALDAGIDPGNSVQVLTSYSIK
jgi:hypothetical protein